MSYRSVQTNKREGLTPQQQQEQQHIHTYSRPPKIWMRNKLKLIGVAKISYPMNFSFSLYVFVSCVNIFTYFTIRKQ